MPKSVEALNAILSPRTMLKSPEKEKVPLNKSLHYDFCIGSGEHSERPSVDFDIAGLIFRSNWRLNMSINKIFSFCEVL